MALAEFDEFSFKEEIPWEMTARIRFERIKFEAADNIVLVQDDRDREPDREHCQQDYKRCVFRSIV